MVLGFILLSSWMLVQILGRVRTETALRGDQDQNDALRASAFQALEVVVGVLAEIRLLEGGLYSRAQGWGDPLRYAGFSPAASPTNALDNETEAESTVSGVAEMASFAFPAGIEVDIEIRDESGRFPLNGTPEARWARLFEAMEIHPSDIATLTDCLLDWIDADDHPRLNGAEAELYRRRNPPYLPANGPITDLYDLRLIEGFDRVFFDERGLPNERFQTIRQCVSTVSTGAVNYNTAPPLVVEVLAEEFEFESGHIADFLTGPDLEPGTADDRILRPDLDVADLPSDKDGKPLDFSATCRYLTVYITSRSLNTTFQLAARLDTECAAPRGLYPVEIVDLQTKGADL